MIDVINKIKKVIIEAKSIQDTEISCLDCRYNVKGICKRNPPQVYISAAGKQCAAFPAARERGGGCFSGKER